MIIAIQMLAGIASFLIFQHAVTGRIQGPASTKQFLQYVAIIAIPLVAVLLGLDAA